VNLTISNGLNPLPGLPPMVPLIPEMLLIKVTVINFINQTNIPLPFSLKSTIFLQNTIMIVKN
jgi:hypothetical protein